jgi:hypothetical protein
MNYGCSPRIEMGIFWKKANANEKHFCCFCNFLAFGLTYEDSHMVELL